MAVKMADHRISCISKLEHHHIDRDNLVFAIGFDGSNGAHAALHMVLKYFMCKRKMATAHMIHVYDDSKEYLPPPQRKAAIQRYLEAYDVSMGKRATMHMLPRLEDKSAGKVVTEFVNEEKNRVDFCVVGFFGRTRKDFHHGEHLLASNVNYMMQYTHRSVIVVKDEFLPYSFIHWVVCVDKTKESEKAVMDALCLSETDDRITVLHIAMRDEDAEAVKEVYTKMVDKCNSALPRPRKVNLVVQTENPSQPPSDDILDYASENNADIICVGTDAARVRRGGTYLGSCAAKVLVCSTTPVVVAHFDSDFGDIIDIKPELQQKIEPMPATSQNCMPGPAYSDLHKWRGSMAMGATGLHPGQ